MKRSLFVGLIAMASASSVFAGSYLKAEAQKSYSDFASDVCDFASSCTDEPTGYRLAFGHSFNEYIALELGYGASGKFKGSDGVEELNFESKSLDLEAVGRLPLNDLFALTGKLGIARTDIETKYSNPFVGEKEDQSSTVPIYGVGVEVGWFTLGYEVLSDAEIDVLFGEPEEDDLERVYAGVKFNF